MSHRVNVDPGVVLLEKDDWRVVKYLADGEVYVDHQCRFAFWRSVNKEGWCVGCGAVLPKGLLMFMLLAKM